MKRRTITWCAVGLLSLAGARSLPAQYVGVIANVTGAGACGSYELVTIRIDNEDKRNANARSGWYGATWTNGYGTEFRLCRVPGSQLPFTSQPYMVFALDGTCPANTLPILRHVDTENNCGESNVCSWVTGSLVGLYPLGYPMLEAPYPTVTDRDVNLALCKFPSVANPTGSFPTLGISPGYGVLANESFPGFERGWIKMDDEDANTNYWCEYSCSSGKSGIQEFRNYDSMIWGGSNTEFRLTRVR